ncbi:hypothetical protein CVS47_00343 [Microbacterium lemovicicum]|uniref:Phosphatidic acid phosphatase type 2/haloperoxidase domain-containing protein n=1 Tax=Microbacterium lemovicicum TaxID=1072463 RepID=A0A3Q9IWA0_9MICO|nr:phosphatase PAP2 family protein [Microbacterium lemovicicum]AZS35746.1 hypothetical protein CVS47_00343 [Microbacterium lemovicicum]
MRTLKSPLAGWSAVAATETVLIIVMGLMVSRSPGWTAFESQVVVAVNATHGWPLDALASGVNVLFGPVAAGVIAVMVVIGAALLARSRKTGMRVAVMIGVPWALADVIKAIVHRARPDAGLLTHPIVVDPTTFSYPSGHTAFAAALMTTMALLVAGAARTWVTVGGAIIVVITGWSRIYLGVHFPTDMLASLLLVPIAVVAFHEITGEFSMFTAVNNPITMSRRGSPGGEPLDARARSDDNRGRGA